MNRNTWWKKLLFPPVWLMLLLLACTAAALPPIFIRDLTETPIAIVVYAIAFYTVGVVTLFCCITLPKQCRQIRRKIDIHPLGHRYLTDPSFRAHVSLYASLAANLLYVGVHILSWFLYRSVWFIILAGYHMILAVMRFLLARFLSRHEIGKNRPGELHRARLCACILLLVNFVLSGAVLMILYQNRTFDYHGVLIYVMAGYTFYATIHAVVDLVKYRKYQSPVMTTSKMITLSAALVSMLSLETAMFSRFGGDMAPESRQLMIALTGAGVSIAVIVMAVLMIARTAKEIKETEKHGRAKRNL